MFTKKAAQYALWAWIFVGVSAPLAQLAGRNSWLGVAVVAVVCGCLCWGIHAFLPETPAPGKWFCVLEYFFLIFAVGYFAHRTQTIWPTGDGAITVPITLLILAAFAAWDGVERVSRTGGVLFWLLALLYAAILASGAKDLKGKWLLPTIQTPELSLLLVFLLPAVAAFLPRQKGAASAMGLCALGLFGTGIALWTSGALSPMVAGTLENPFYEFSKSLSLLGVAERFESFVSVAFTLGYFALLSLLFCAAGHLAERIHPGWGRGGILGCALLGGAVCLLPLQLPDLVLGMLGLLFWGILPYLGGFFSQKSRKNHKKAEKGQSG